MRAWEENELPADGSPPDPAKPGPKLISPPIYNVFRLCLWILPTAYGIATPIAIRVLEQLAGFAFKWSDTADAVFILSILVVIIASGWCHAKISTANLPESKDMVAYIVLFLLPQIFLTPLLMAMTAWWLIYLD